MKQIVIILFCIGTLSLQAQSFYFGPKLGPAANFQRWGNGSNDPLISVNADIFIESAPEDDKNFLYASIGYRTRGSAWRTGNFNGNISFNATKFKFNNGVLELGFKRMLTDAPDNRPFYFMALRAEYTLSTNLEQYNNSFFYPQTAFTNRFMYGGSFGGGYEFKFREMMKFFVELGIHPDASLQYNQPDGVRATDPFTGNSIILTERMIRNMSLELKFGMKFLRKVEYY